MYKLLLCWRYLRTRYLAMICIVSVMLGVATLIVVNSVMAGFSTKLRDRLHGLLSDVVVECYQSDGFADPEGIIRHIQQLPVGQHIEAMAPTIEVFALMQYPARGVPIAKTVKLIGIDPESRTKVGNFAQYLYDKNQQPAPASFALDEEALSRYRHYQPMPGPEPMKPEPQDASQLPPPEEWVHEPRIPRGIIVGQALVSYRDKRPDGTTRDENILEPGDPVNIITYSGGKLTGVFEQFVVCSYFKSEMSEYDAHYVFVPLDYLQRLRGMQDRATAIQIKLTDFAHAKTVVEELKRIFPPTHFTVQTWEDKQGPLLAAIAIERGILNVLLFMIVGVAGFGILAIFSMIVVEKTRDIGVLKALGASNRGVMAIFLGFGLLLGIVGDILGSGIGLMITKYLNEIEQFLAQRTGQQIFNREVYYFDKIPTHIEPWSIVLVNLGAIAIAVAFSVIPAFRAAMLQPVRALRFE